MSLTNWPYGVKYANNKGADQSAHRRSLIAPFVFSGAWIVCLAKMSDKMDPKKLISQLFTCMNRSMKFPTMWYVRPAKPKISLRICAV